ncbi:hypothetical protein ABZ178_22670 [Streptomyces massasporeus]|uniref:hypothetical protein n=1 Tax=Streptomyces massasporeus TaxID=67324 RepID=UPI0033B6B1C2
MAQKEIGLRPTRREDRTVRRLHDAFPAVREEPFFTLMANPAAGDGKVHALKKVWGYERIRAIR